jgi:Protein kinase domain
MPSAPSPRPIRRVQKPARLSGLRIDSNSRLSSSAVQLQSHPSSTSSQTSQTSFSLQSISGDDDIDTELDIPAHSNERVRDDANSRLRMPPLGVSESEPDLASGVMHYHDDDNMSGSGTSQTKKLKLTKPSSARKLGLRINNLKLAVDLKESYELSKNSIRTRGFEITEAGVIATPDAQPPPPAAAAAAAAAVHRAGSGAPSPAFRIDSESPSLSDTDVVAPPLSMPSNDSQRISVVPPIRADLSSLLRPPAMKSSSRTMGSGSPSTPLSATASGARSFRTPGSLGKRMSAADVIEFGVAGAGQNGVVKKALFLSDLDIVAVKAISVYDNARRHQMTEELKVFLNYNHPNLINLVGAYYNDGTLCMALEYMNRGSLHRLVEKQGPLSGDIIRSVAKQLAAGLAYIHSQYQIHRDIKPENVLLNNRGDVKISDFGLVKQLSSSNDVCHTFLGTTSYLSPERITGKDFSFPADIWSLGITLIYCASGTLPLPNEYWALVTNISQNPSPSLDRSRFSAKLCDFIDQCLKKDPNDRATAEMLMKHPFLLEDDDDDNDDDDDDTVIQMENDQQTDDQKLDRKPAAAVFTKLYQSDLRDLDKVMQIVAKHVYGEKVKFKNSLYDRRRFQHLAEQMGLPAQVVAESFHKNYFTSVS